MIPPDSWRPSSGLTLEPNARRAVISQAGCIALLAGPGAGKTETLAQRADFLLRTGVCPYPKRILAISFKKDASENLKERAAKRCGRELAARFDSYTFHAFGKRLIDIFRTALKGPDQLDEDYTVGDHRLPRSQITFKEMVPLANEVLDQCAAARNAIRSTYSDVFLDEFQDCTDAQYTLVLNAFQGSGARIIAVGDTKQKIMGWAGALEGIFLKFEEDFRATPLNLYQNFRSLHRIRRVHNRMVRDIDPEAAVPDDQIALDEGEVAWESFDDDEAEAEWAADSILLWNEQGVPFSQIAFLCNNQPHLYALKIMSVLSEHGIPFRNEQEIQDLSAEPLFCLIVDFLLVLLGDAEPDAWERLQGILGDESGEGSSKLRDWDRFLRSGRSEIRKTRTFRKGWTLIEAMLMKLGTEAIRSLSHDYENEARRTEILGNIKAHIETGFDNNADPLESLKSIGGVDAVRILTIHKCKGLEFHTVIVQGVETQTFWGEEEAAGCAFFVAISRARKRLVTTTSEFREKLPGANRYWSQQRTPHQRFLGYVESEAGGTL
ncbi:ATP-dependent helicase [Phragmitibacter flavus]|uniref:DNA 3'-5' helicase n=1 Tax=Phragmitibacter flavus TaxID=2576071 RepID=A0A5R8KHA0_9BACT|nr:ATP-dependent helicase [Phragmitibacter flavus]TLD71694.1 ATP-dependent helicase [Phragmitibacter flavus]